MLRTDVLQTNDIIRKGAPTALAVAARDLTEFAVCTRFALGRFAAAKLAAANSAN